MTTTVDLTAILAERTRLVRIIDEAGTARSQIALINKLIVLKQGNKPLPGADEDAAGSDALPDESEPNGRYRNRRGASVNPGVLCPVPDCDKRLRGSFGIRNHFHSAHPHLVQRKTEQYVDQVKEALAHV